MAGTVLRTVLVLVHVTLSASYEICIIITFTDKESEVTQLVMQLVFRPRQSGPKVMLIAIQLARK